MEEEKKEPKPRGGFREGAGRKPKDGVGTQNVSVRINRNYLRVIRLNYDHLSTFIDKAIRNQLKREGII